MAASNFPVLDETDKPYESSQSTEKTRLRDNFVVEFVTPIIGEQDPP